MCVKGHQVRQCVISLNCVLGSSRCMASALTKVCLGRAGAESTHSILSPTRQTAPVPPTLLLASVQVPWPPLLATAQPLQLSPKHCSGFRNWPRDCWPSPHFLQRVSRGESLWLSQPGPVGKSRRLQATQLSQPRLLRTWLRPWVCGVKAADPVRTSLSLQVFS